jgi:hypothetical protein
MHPLRMGCAGAVAAMTAERNDMKTSRPAYVESHDGEQTLITRPKDPAHGRAVLMFSRRSTEPAAVGEVIQWKGIDYVVEKVTSSPYRQDAAIGLALSMSADPLEAQPGQA